MQTMGIIDIQKLYDEDEHLWYFENAHLFREGKYADILLTKCDSHIYYKKAFLDLVK